MSSDSKYRAVNEALATAIPELRPRYEQELTAWGEEMGPHVIYADVLNPFLAQLLAAPDENEETLRRIFQFLEELLAHPDTDFSDVARVTVAEDLESDRDRLEVAREFMGPLMLEETRNRLAYRPRPRRRET
jgi:hypothetical protein